ncbi:hypothetical protein JCGZ_00821 [Jatropha curcas]|uniref:2S n=1 Tax=Jatropha curcas TaxID=180498 RepID=A0A067L4P9_JATCU|nr:2S albumin-like precursor [Jatropha curcas]AIA57959.1 2S [Jatropha curcas]KDP39064.1 hypothetical protein JCGZ_00821 [Jatropha curcas]
MAKLTILLASFIALLFLVDASIYRTTLITDENDDNQFPPYDRPTSCQQQIQSQQRLRACQQYLRQQTGSPWGRRFDNEENQMEREECCRQLQRMEARCRCDGLRQAIDQLQRRGILGGQDVREAYMLARQLPSECGVSPRQCHFGTRWWF